MNPVSIHSNVVIVADQIHVEGILILDIQKKPVSLEMIEHHTAAVAIHSSAVDPHLQIDMHQDTHQTRMVLHRIKEDQSQEIDLGRGIATIIELILADHLIHLFVLIENLRS